MLRFQSLEFWDEGLSVSGFQGFRILTFRDLVFQHVGFQDLGVGRFMVVLREGAISHERGSPVPGARLLRSITIPCSYDAV